MTTFTKRDCEVAIAIASHEPIVASGLNSVGTWTWSMGLTSAIARLSSATGGRRYSLLKALPLLRGNRFKIS